MYLKLCLATATSLLNHDSPKLNLANQAPIEFHDDPLAIAHSMAGRKIILLDPLDYDKIRSPTNSSY
jgi:hypothetical protein